jgi:hypothetical protein
MDHERKSTAHVGSFPNEQRAHVRFPNKVGRSHNTHLHESGDSVRWDCLWCHEAQRPAYGFAPQVGVAQLPSGHATVSPLIMRFTSEPSRFMM